MRYIEQPIPLRFTDTSPNPSILSDYAPRADCSPAFHCLNHRGNHCCSCGQAWSDLHQGGASLGIWKYEVHLHQEWKEVCVE